MAEPRNVVSRALVTACAAALVLFAEPTQASTAVGGAVLAAGAALWIATSAYDRDGAPAARGGPFAHVRNPELLAWLLAGAGLVLLAASEGSRGRWVPRAVAPIALLVFFGDVLPRADARLRDAARARDPEAAARYLERVPALVPRARAFAEGAWRGARLRGATRAKTLAVLLGWGVLASLCVARARWSDALGF